MNLLDQLFQYSCKTESSSIISFSALPEDSPALSSIINTSLAQSQVKTNSQAFQSSDRRVHQHKSSLDRGGQSRKALDTFYFAFNKAYKINQDMMFRQAFRNMKRITGPIPKINMHNKIKLFTGIHFAIEKPLPSMDWKQNENTKIPYLHPQRKQIQNTSLCDNMSIFFPKDIAEQGSSNSAYGSCRKESSQTLQTSIVKDLSQNYFQTHIKDQHQERKTPKITQFTVSSQVQEDFALLASQQEDLPKFARTCQENMYRNRESIQPFIEENERIFNRTQRLSPKFIEDESKKYSILRRSMQKKQLALKQICKSKETIRKVVYELQRSKSKCNKQHIKISARKGSKQKKESSVQEYRSPARHKSVEDNSQRGNSRQVDNPDKRCIYTIQQQQKDATNQMEQNMGQLQCISKNLQVYYNYMKAKQNNKQIQSSKKNHTYKHKSNHQKPPIAKPKTQNQEFLQINSGFNSKEGTARSRKIDLKVDLSNLQKNKNRKMVVRKGNK